jgi:hypothetical protein
VLGQRSAAKACPERPAAIAKGPDKGRWGGESRELVNVTAPIRPIGGRSGRKKAPDGGYSKNGVLFIARDFWGCVPGSWSWPKTEVA